MVIVVTTYIYVRAGREIYIKHRELKDLNYTSHYEPEPLPLNNPFNTKTTEVTVSVSEAPGSIDLSHLGVSSHDNPLLSGRTTHPAAYSVSISAQPATSSASATPPGPTTIPGPHNSPTTPTTPITPITTGGGAAAHPQQQQQQHYKSRRKAAIDANNAAWSYTKVAMLFFTAMLVTWIPSSANRLYSLAVSGQISLPLEYMSAFVLPLQGFWNAIIYCTTSWKACKMLGDDVQALFFSCCSCWMTTGRKQQQRTRKRAPSKAAAGKSVTMTPSSAGGVLTGVLRSRSRMEPERGFVRSGKDSETESMEELADRSGSLSA